MNVSPGNATLLFAPECLPFSVALAVMLGIAALEGAALLLGGGFGPWLDGALPEGLDADLGPDVGEVSALAKVLGWLHVGRVPALVVLVCALMWFGLTGLALQATVASLVGGLAPAAIAAPLALAAALPLTRATAALLGRLLPRDETSAVSRESFVGRVARMLEVAARKGEPAQAKLHDAHGQAQYVLVEPEDEGTVLEAGSEVLLVRHAGAYFTAIPNVHRALSPQRQGERT
jgi:hypothetical protein